MFMRFYMYMIMVTFKMNFFKVLKNSFIFAILCIGRNFLALIGIVAMALITLYLGITYPPLSIIMMVVVLFGGCTFISTYVAYPQMKKYMIDPYYDDAATDPEEANLQSHRCGMEYRCGVARFGHGQSHHIQE